MSVADPVVELFSQVQEDIYAELTKKIMRVGSYEASRWQVQKALEWGALKGDVKKIIRESTQLSEKEIEKIITEASKETLTQDGKIYQQAGLKITGLTTSPTLMAIILQGTKDTNALVTNFSNTTAITADQAFINSVDRAFLQVMSGSFDQNQAIHQAVNDLAKKGIEKVAYPSGISQSLEASVRRAVITSTNQATAKLQIAVMDDLGVDLVEVSSHGGARPSHAEWQGQIYSRSGKHKKYANFEQSTGYGTGPGLCGWNCYHSFFPFFEGLSTPAFSKDPSKDQGEDNDLVYHQQQQQRKMERDIRKSKRELVTLKTARDNTNEDYLRAQFQNDFEQASIKLKKRRDKLNQFLKETGRGAEPEREMVAGFGHSVSSSAVWAAKRAGNK